MKINDFSTLIELIATISIGFIAAEYVKSYTSIICEKIFNHFEFISKSYNDCHRLLTDPETLEHIEVIDIDGKSTIDVVEELKLDHENLRKEIIEEEEKQKKVIIEVCQIKSISSICFYIFLSCLVLLWGNIFENTYKSYTHIFSCIYTLFSSLYLVLAWFLGEKEYTCVIFNFSSLRHSFICFVLFFLLSLFIVLFSTINNNFTALGSFCFWGIFIYVMLSYLNFIVFAFKISIKSKKFKNKVTESRDNIMIKCERLRDDTQDLLAVSRVNTRLSI